jgi:hypothetical protein
MVTPTSKPMVMPATAVEKTAAPKWPRTALDRNALLAPMRAPKKPPQMRSEPRCGTALEVISFLALAVSLVTTLSSTALYDVPNAACASGDLKERAF